MRVSNKQMKKYLEKKISVSSDAAKIKETVQKATDVYYVMEEKKFLDKAEFLYKQSRFIQKRWWVAQGILLAVLWLILHYSESGYYIQRGIGIAAPLFVILLIPEIWKNKYYNAMEVECTTYYSLRQVYMARMLLFALVDMILLTVFFCAISYTGKLVMLELIIQFFIPFNITCCICFQTLYSKKTGSEIVALLVCMVWIVVWVQIVLNEAVYSSMSLPIWILSLIVSAAYLGYSIYRGQKKCIEMWEVTTIWN